MATEQAQTTEVAGSSGLRRSLRRRHMQMIALGGVIGAGLFVGSGVVIGAAGPAAVISFALTGVLVVLVMRMLGEMAVAYPAVGGFYEYNRLALGELAGFLTGWMYWYFWVIVVALEAVAGAKILGTWWPSLAPWQYTLGLVSTFTVVNLLSVRSYGEAEFWFASIKVAAIVAFLCAGTAFALGAWPGAHGGISQLTAHGGFMPNGIVPVLTGAVAATGFYFGAEIVTIAAAESVEPERAVAETTQSVIWRVLVFYVGSIFLVVAIVPWSDGARMARPYVSVMEALQIPAAPTVMSIVVLTVAELKLRRRLEREAPARLRVRMWGYPWLTRLTIIAMLAIVAAMGVIPEQRVALLFGLLSVAVLLVAFVLRHRALLRFPARRQGALR